jgi:hypothetical protein
MSGFLIFLLLLALMILLICLGYQLSHDKVSAERDELDERRQVLDVEWMALEQTRRINEVFFQARQALRHAEADARQRRPIDPMVIETEAVDVQDEPWRSERPR